MYYLTETDPRGAMGLGGKEEVGLGSLGAFLTAIDYKTGKTVWRHRYPGLGGSLSNGVLTTAGKLLFAGDLGGQPRGLRPCRWQDPLALASGASVERAGNVHAGR